MTAIVQSSRVGHFLPVAGTCVRWGLSGGRLTGLLTAVFGLSMMLAPNALAGWSAPARVPTGGLPQSVDVGIDGAGHAVATWAQLDTADVESVAVADASGGASGWGSAEILSSPGMQSMFPRMAVAPSGAAVVVWQAYTSPTVVRLPWPPAVWAAYRSTAAGAWSKPVEISSGVGLDPSVAIDSDGQATVAWGLVNGDAVASFDPRSATWSKPVTLRTVDPGPPLVADNARGETIVVWRQSITGSLTGPDGTSAEIAAAVKRTPTSRWEATRLLGREIEPPLQADRTWEEPGPQIALDAAGDAIVVWQGGRPPTPVVSVATYSAGADRWHQDGAITNGFALWPHVASTPGGNATVVWLNAQDQPAASSARIGSRQWTTTTLLTSIEGNAYPHVSVDSLGDAVATWIGSKKQEDAAVRLGINDRWHHATALGPAIDYEGATQNAIDASGQAVAIWTKPNVSLVSATDDIRTTR
ncbi:MAG: hypothetical protein ACLP0J_11765 [Solirubrobacteraceae bacterium]